MEHLTVRKVGSVVRGVPPLLPWRLVDADGGDVDAVCRWLTDLYVCDGSPATLRAYSYDLLGWLRFLDALDVSWKSATRWEVRDWVRWYRAQQNPQRSRGRADGCHRPEPGAVNEKTGKPYLEYGYARSSINRRLSALSSFYDFAVEADLGPLINPVPRSREQVLRVNAHVPAGEVTRHRERRAPYRQRVVERIPRALSDELYEEVFAKQSTNRNRAIIATVASSGMRASELLSMRRGLLHAADQTVEIIPKGGNGIRALVPILALAFMWIARYLAERPVGPPQEPVWMTLRGPVRPLTYWALRQILERTSQLLGSNVTMHDFRHTFCMRLAQDENMTVAQMQELMRHASLVSTMRYLRSNMDELVESLNAHWNRPPAPPPTPAKNYAAEDFKVLFGEGF